MGRISNEKDQVLRYPLGLRVLHLHFAPCLTNFKVIQVCKTPKIRKLHRASKFSKSFNNLSMELVLLQFLFVWLQPAKLKKKTNEKSAHLPARSGTGVASSNRFERFIWSLAPFARKAMR